MEYDDNDHLLHLQDAADLIKDCLDGMRDIVKYGGDKMPEYRKQDFKRYIRRLELLQQENDCDIDNVEDALDIVRAETA